MCGNTDRRNVLTAAAAGLLTLASIGTASAESRGASDEEDPVVAVTLADWRVEVDRDVIAPAGDVTFDIDNASDKHGHELVVRERDEEGKYVAVAEQERFPPGEARSLTVSLDPGPYELACLIREEDETVDGRIEDHYRFGMHTTVDVRGEGSPDGSDGD